LLDEAFLAKKQMNPYITEHTQIEEMLGTARPRARSAARSAGQAVAATSSSRPAFGARSDPGRARAIRRAIRGVRLLARWSTSEARARRVGTFGMNRRFALVDRDGTINVERDHITDPGQIELIPGSAEALVRLREEVGMGIVIVTNQAHVGRGELSPADLDRIHERLLALLADEGAAIDAILHCPHAPDAGCACRKPAPGLALQAADRFGFDPSASVVIGDHAADVGLGRAVGATTFLVLTGHGQEERMAAEPLADHVVPDLAAAVDIIAALVPREG
jgi:D-glycero-D-manno-heptose 1,7-bisphosphate phosphatase